MASDPITTGIEQKLPWLALSAAAQDELIRVRKVQKGQPRRRQQSRSKVISDVLQGEGERQMSSIGLTRARRCAPLPTLLR
jgi:hypothetical protein